MSQLAVQVDIPELSRTDGPEHARLIGCGRKAKGLTSRQPFVIVIGAGEKSRTPDLRITNALLYQLSYAGVAHGLRAVASRAF